MSNPHRLPGPRDVRVTLDGDGSDRIVVACPPHPQMGGDRHDSRLTAVSDRLSQDDIDCLRFDYGEWSEGVGERTDALTALSWASDSYDSVGLFGYSFGGGIALLAAVEMSVDAVAVLAPVSVVGDDLLATAALESITTPVQVIYGEHDDTANWQPVVDRARELGQSVEGLSADHFFAGQTEPVAEVMRRFFDDELGRA